MDTMAAIETAEKYEKLADMPQELQQAVNLHAHDYYMDRLARETFNFKTLDTDYTSESDLFN